MKKRGVLFFGILLVNYALAQTGSLSGQITNAKNQFVGLAKINMGGSVNAFTNHAGFFELKNIPYGNYKLRVVAKGYLSYETSIVINAGQQTFNVQLNAEITELKIVEINANIRQERKNGEARNIEIVDQQFIQRHLGGSLMQTLERLPGVSNIGIGSGQSKPLIRGLGFSRVVVIDRGIKHEGQQWGTDHGLEIDQFAAGDIEVIKGSSSFIYGSEAIGGVINIKPVSRPINRGAGGVINLTGKSNNAFYGSSINLFGRNQKWFLDGRVTYQNYADYRVPTDTVHVYDYPVRLYKNRLRNTAGRETDLHFTADYVGKFFKSSLYFSNSYAKSGFFANAHGLEPRKVDEALHNNSDRDLLSPYQLVNHFKAINRIEFSHPKSKTEIELGFQRNFRQEFNHYVNHGYMPPIYPGDMQIPKNLEQAYDKLIYSGNAKHSINFHKHQLQFGINNDYQNNRIDGWSFLIPAFKQFNTGLFAYNKYIVNNSLILHSGLRYDYGHILFERYDDWFASEKINGSVTASERLTRALKFGKDFNSFVWSAGVNYNPGKLNVKTNVGKSFRMPVAKELAANGVNYHYFSYEKGNADLDAEVAYQVDVGFTWAEKNWLVAVSPFYNYFPNYIYLNPTPYHDYYYGAGNQVFEYTQSRVIRYGAELKINHQFLPNFSAEFLGEYLYSEQLSGDKKGFTLPFSLPPSALLNLAWTPKLSGKLKNTYLSVDYRITARQNHIVPPEKKNPGYQIVNIQLGTTILLNKQTVELSLQAQNLFNAKYLNHASFYRLIELPEAGTNIILLLKIPFKIN